MTQSEQQNALMELAQNVVQEAQKQGATVAEASVRQGSHLSTKVRMREAELVEEAGSRSLGLRVMVGQQVAVSYTSDLSLAGRARLIDDAIELAKLSQPDPFAGPPDASLLSSESEHIDLDLFDAGIDDVDGKTSMDWALEGEGAALDYDARIGNSEGSTFTRASGMSVLATSGGFVGTSRGTYASISVQPVADDEGGKKRTGSYWGASRHFADLQSAREIGEEAARRTLRKLGASKIPSAEMPVVFDPDAARSIIGLFAGCVMGSSIWRKSSFLVDRLKTEVASPLVTLVDDPTLPRAPGSRAFDGEGLLSRRNVVVDRGVLKTYLMDSYSARKLEMESTASASRGSSGGVGASTTNFMMLPGAMTQEELLADTKSGLYVTGMMGFGFNSVTGDFSRGASGFLIEGGELGRPVSEVTISLNLGDLFGRIDAIADDLDLRTSTASPTFRVSSMTVAGS